MNRRDHEAIVPPDHEWEQEYREMRYAPVLRVGRTLYVSGPVGLTEDEELPEDPGGQIRRAFLNIADTLRAAGATWADVVEGTSNHVGLREHADVFLEVHQEFVQKPHPTWTAVGVTELLTPRAIIEISVVALRPDERA